MFDFSAVDHGF